MRKLILLLFTLNCWASFPLVTLSSKVDKAKVNSGDIVKYTITMEFKKELNLELPELGDNIMGFRIVEFGKEDPIEEEGRRTLSRWYTLQADLAGSYILPAMEMKYKSEKGEEKIVKTSEIFVEVESNFKDGEDKEKQTLVDIKPLRESNRSLTLLSWILVGILLLVVGVLVLIWHRTKKAKSKPIDLPKAHQIATLEFDELESEGLLEKGEIKAYYFRFNETLKNYYESLTDVSVTDMTLEEMSRILKNRKLQKLDEFLSIIKESELVKFSDMVPTIEEGENLLSEARMIVKDTKPSEIEIIEESVI